MIRFNNCAERMKPFTIGSRRITNKKNKRLKTHEWLEMNKYFPAKKQIFNDKAKNHCGSKQLFLY